MGRHLEWGDNMSLSGKIFVIIGTLNPEMMEYTYSELKLPATNSEIEDAMQKARIINNDNNDISIEITNCQDLPEFEGVRLDGQMLEELNFFASRMAKLAEWELAAAGAIFCDMIEKSEENDEGISMTDLINMTYGLDSVPVMNGIKSDEQLGEYIIDNGVEEYIKKLSDEAISCLDIGQVGRKYREKENGEYMDGYYVGVGHYKKPEVYDGEHLPLEENPELGEGVFRLLIAKAPEEDPEEVLKNAKWIALPIVRDKADELAKSLGENRIEDCVYYDMRTGITKIDELVYTDMKQFDKLNELARKYSEFAEAHKVCFKALLERESPETLDDVLEIAEREDQYNFTRNAVDAEDFAQMYLKYHLPGGFDYKFISELEVTSFADKLLDRLGADVTNYGIVSGRGRSLFEIVPYDKLTSETRQDSVQMGGMEM